MTKRRVVVAGIVALSILLGAPAWAQEAPAPASVPRKEPPKPVIPLQVQVVLSRYDGEKKIANLPFTLAVSTNDQTVQLNMQTQVGVPSMPVKDNATNVPPPPIGPFTYKTIGTSITCTAWTLDDGRFRVMLGVSDNSMLPDKAVDGQRVREAGLSGLPSFQEFRSANVLILRDGQTVQYAAATDAVTGQVTKIEVTITVIK